MTLIAEITRAQSARFIGRRVSDQEAAIRDLVVEWGRQRWPGARVCHELTMGQGQCRADVAFIGESSFAVVEIKSDYDSTERLIGQAAWFRLTAPEAWIVTTSGHGKDVDLIRYLLPTIGVAGAFGPERYAPPVRIDVRHEHLSFKPDHRAMLYVLWAGELYAECVSHRIWSGKKSPTMKVAVDLIMERLSEAEIMALVCRRLRARDAVWRADPPIPAPDAGSAT